MTMTAPTTRIVDSGTCGYAPGRHVLQYRHDDIWSDVGDPHDDYIQALEAERRHLAEHTELVRYGYIDTMSSAGRPVPVRFHPPDVVAAAQWVNFYGNPSTVLRMRCGSYIYLVDDYGAMNDLGHVRVRQSGRRKDLAFDATPSTWDGYNAPACRCSICSTVEA
ncbi:MAG: hypothetical protein KDB37_17435 [Ilumatobacter sp.]|nr:hypothetical protein [Ilumatobacter sp.]